MHSAYSLILEKRPPEWAHPLRQAALLKALELALHANLEAPLAAHCRVGLLSGTRLTLWADGPVWATKLRLTSLQLVEKLAKINGLPTVGEIKVKVQPRQLLPPPKAEQITRRSVTKEALMQMQTFAEGVRDPALRTALLRLARRLKK